MWHILTLYLSYTCMKVSKVHISEYCARKAYLELMFAQIISSCSTISLLAHTPVCRQADCMFLGAFSMKAYLVSMFARITSSSFCKSFTISLLACNSSFVALRSSRKDNKSSCSCKIQVSNNLQSKQYHTK